MVFIKLFYRKNGYSKMSQIIVKIFGSFFYEIRSYSTTKKF